MLRRCTECEDGSHQDCRPDWIDDWGYHRECDCATMNHDYPLDEPVKVIQPKG